MLAREYGEIANELLWRVATLHMSDLIEKLETMIPSIPS
jgi:hypothetical protein